MWRSSSFKAGEWVEVRSKEEILATLDENGRLQELPFMPEMFQYCGKRLEVYKRAHKTCDPPNGLSGRRMESSVHLAGARCDGSAHGGCEAACLIFWKDAWLKKGKGSERVAASVPHVLPPNLSDRPASGSTADAVWAGTRAFTKQPQAQEPVYVCQATQVHAATQPLRWWDLRQYVEDYTSANVRPAQMLAALLVFVYEKVATARLGLGSPLAWAYDACQRVRRGTPFPWRVGRLPVGAKTPSARLDLQPGELVRVRSYRDILETLDETNHNRGMWFDAEMVPYCGRTYRVLRRVNTIIDEKTGKLLRLKNDCIQLDEVVCRACYAKYRRFCPRSIYAYWREVWLERLPSDRTAAANKRTS